MLLILRGVGSVLGRLAFLAGIRSKVTLENLARAYPKLSPKERRKLADYEAERALVRERLAAVQAEDK